MENAAGKTDKSLLASIAIDGTAIKTIRETKKLTQLYVASVVGVTTDTISRWENNRYPTIRRDNAEKLATALEVGLAEILRQEVVVEVAEPAPPDEPTRRNLRTIVYVSLVLAIAAGVAYFYFNLSSTTMAVRQVPRYAAPGEVIPVQIKVTRRDTGSRGFIIKERLPPGWRLVNAAPAPASGEPAAEEVKWLIPGGKGPVTVSYTVRIAAMAAVEQKTAFAGKIIVQTGGISRTEAIGGDYNVVVGAYHWADVNGDRRIDDNEIMPAYYLTEEMKGLGLDWKGIEAIWSGKGYGWDPEKKIFIVIK